MHCDKHVVKMLLECLQILYTALSLRGCAVTAPLVLPSGETRAPYKPTHARHPCVLWAAGCQTHFAWVVRLARALSAEYTRRYGKQHLCSYHLEHVQEHLRTHGFPPAMPLTVTPADWLQWVSTRVSAKAASHPRVATVNPPEGTAFGVLAITDNTSDPVRTASGELDAVASYRRFYAWKAEHRVKMRWCRAADAPATLAPMFVNAM